MKNIKETLLAFCVLSGILLAISLPACDNWKPPICESQRRCPPETRCAAEADVCVSTRCGNGMIDILDGEICDDGNIQSGDGCSSRCLSETCGNEFIDRAYGEVCDDGVDPVTKKPVSGDGCSAECLSEKCGDGVLNAGEECDDGNTDSGDGCNVRCLFEGCGNGLVDEGETCDDGNDLSGDGCSNTCYSEHCGNGSVEAGLGEICDDGDTVSGDGCSWDCASTEVCGNGTLDRAQGEECDDGNLDSGDSCSADCKFEVCGNGIVDMNEVCDDGKTDSGDGCRGDCMSDEQCGNMLLDSEAGEECDDGNMESGDGCSSACTLEQCGNGIVDVNEVCDDGNNVSGDGCSSNCLSDEQCGNGITDLGEECDCGAGSYNGGVECAGQQNSMNGGYCRSDCMLHCGDGILNSEETCDDAIIGQASCVDFQFDLGHAYCSACEFVINDCRNFTAWERMTSNTTCDLVTVWGNSATNVYVGGNDCETGDSGVHHYNGTSWSMEPVDSGLRDYRTIWGIDSNNIFAAGGSRLTNDGDIQYCNGTQWMSMPYSGGAVETVWGTQADSVFAVSVAFAIFFWVSDLYHYDGQTWTKIEVLGIYTSWWKMWGNSDSDLYLVGTHYATLTGEIGSHRGIIMHWDGVQLTEVGPPVIEPLHDVWASSPTDLFIVGDHGAILHYNGLGWQFMNSTTGEDLLAITGNDSNDVFAVGTNGILLHYNGVSWTRINSHTSATLYDIWTTSNEIFAVGEGGTIMRYRR